MSLGDMSGLRVVRLTLLELLLQLLLPLLGTQPHGERLGVPVVWRWGPGDNRM